MKISFLTLGCRANQSESAKIESSLFDRGHEIVSLGGGPDICVVNTCTVTAKSDYQSRQQIRRARRAGARVVVTGCYAELNSESVGSMEGVERVVRNDSKDSISGIIGDATDPGPARGQVLKKRARHTMKVQDGCSNSCTYCIVPLARGASRSDAPEMILKAVNDVVSSGCNEVVLSGIHLGHYGLDHVPALGLEALVRMVLDRTELRRLRLSSLEVTEIGPGLIDLMKDERICNHLHIPIQSGSDGVLNRMGRKYDIALFRERILEISATLGDIGLGTDVIAGFPDETEMEFDETLNLIRELPFTYLHVFKYSRRPGTKAAAIKDIVGDEARKVRSSALLALSDEKRASHMLRQVGKVHEMLVEEEFEEGLWQGTTSNYLKVQAALAGPEAGSIAPVAVKGVGSGCLIAVPIKSS